MRKTLLAIAIAVASPITITACTPTEIGQVNSASSKTEIAANVLYTSASKAGETLVANGLLDKARFKELDNKAYTALRAIRAGTGTLAQLVAITSLMSGASK